MSFKRKLIYYLIGVVLGVILIKAIWAKRDIHGTYFPSERIVYDISKKEINYSKEAESSLNTFSISKKSIIEKLKKGDFDAKVIDRDSKPCKTYQLESEFFSKDYIFDLSNCDSTVFVNKITQD